MKRGRTWLWKARWWGAAAVLAGAWTWITAATPKPFTADPALTGIPDVVILDQLSKSEKLYEPVPFDHKAHAGMAQLGGSARRVITERPRTGRRARVRARRRPG